MKSLNVRRMKSVVIMLVVGPKSMAVSMAEAAALRRARHLQSEHLPGNANLWICTGSKKTPSASHNLRLTPQGDHVDIIFLNMKYDVTDCI